MIVLFKSGVGKTTLAEQRQIASKVTEIGRISVVMYVSDQFVSLKLQLIDYRDPIQSNPMSITEAGQGLYFRLFLKFKIQKHK